MAPFGGRRHTLEPGGERDTAENRDFDRLCGQRPDGEQIERLDRQLVRVGQLPAGPTFPLGVSLWKIGGGFWVWLEGEYYQYLQRTLRTRLPETPIVVATVVDGWRPAYLPTRETYGRGIYQEQVAVLAPGCLEAVTDSVAEKISAWL